MMDQPQLSSKEDRKVKDQKDDEVFQFHLDSVLVVDGDWVVIGC